MDKVNELILLHESRQYQYKLLSTVYLLEVDVELFEDFKTMEFPKECGQPELARGYELVRSYVENAPDDWEEELAVDYARVFLSAGVAQGIAAFPYESIYTSQQRLMMQESGSDLASIYAAKGVKPREDMYKVQEDHIGLELDFMAMLCEDSIEAIKAENNGAYGESIQKQRSFLAEHLRSWVGGFCDDIYRYAMTDFYKGVARITSGFLRLDAELLNMTK